MRALGLNGRCQHLSTNKFTSSLIQSSTRASRIRSNLQARASVCCLSLQACTASHASGEAARERLRLRLLPGRSLKRSIESVSLPSSVIMLALIWPFFQRPLPPTRVPSLPWPIGPTLSRRHVVSCSSPSIRLAITASGAHLILII